jgi:hypothetical protein
MGLWGPLANERDGKMVPKLLVGAGNFDCDQPIPTLIRLCTNIRSLCLPTCLSQGQALSVCLKVQAKASDHLNPPQARMVFVDCALESEADPLLILRKKV